MVVDQPRLLHLVPHGDGDRHPPRFRGEARGQARRRIQAAAVERDQGRAIVATEEADLAVMACVRRWDEAEGPVVPAAQEIHAGLQSQIGLGAGPEGVVEDLDLDGRAPHAMLRRRATDPSVGDVHGGGDADQVDLPGGQPLPETRVVADGINPQVLALPQGQRLAAADDLEPEAGVQCIHRSGLTGGSRRA